MTGNKRSDFAVTPFIMENVIAQSFNFEDLINNREPTLNSMLDYIETTSGYKIPTPRSEAIPILLKAIQPRKSHTIRGGRTGDWRSHFTEEHKKMFKEAAGNLLVELGYEKNNDW